MVYTAVVGDRYLTHYAAAAAAAEACDVAPLQMLRGVPARPTLPVLAGGHAMRRRRGHKSLEIRVYRSGPRVIARESARRGARAPAGRRRTGRYLRYFPVCPARGIVPSY